MANNGTTWPTGIVGVAGNMAIDTSVGPVPRLNVAVTFCPEAGIVNEHVAVVLPAHGALHPVNVDPVAAAAVSVTAVPEARFTAQPVLEPVVQVIPFPVTAPAPVPAVATVSGNVVTVPLNVAVTACARFMVTVHVPVVFVHAPLQPAKVEPVAGVAVNVTGVPEA